MFEKWKKRLEEKRRLEQQTIEQQRKERLAARMNADSMSILFWGYGPGKPFDSSYTLIKREIDTEKNDITLYFDGNEKCTIINPIGVQWDGKLPTIKSADKIIWESYDYDKPPSEETRSICEYILVDGSHVRFIMKDSRFNIDKIIDVSGESAMLTIPG